MKTLTLSALTLGLALTGCMMSPKESKLIANLSGAQEVPAVTTAGGGTVRVTLNEDTRMLTVMGGVSGLSGAPTMAHIHGPAARGATAGVLKPLSCPAVNNGCTLSGSFMLTTAEVEQLKANLWYVNVHTAANPSGEVRGQLE